MYFAVLLSLLLPSSSLAASGSDPAWLALLHFSGGSSSAAAGTPFFLSPEGNHNPQAELEATQAYFRESPESAACRFPARAIYLGLEKEGNSELCGRWRRWREAIGATGAELVFAAAFLSSPSSMYGHTLLKFSHGKNQELLDYTLSYGAKTGKIVGLPYVWLGLTGGFSGNYATAPFYLKVKEYNYVENRDFWIYPLVLSARQLRVLVAHSWELREVDFPYFFLHRNCSYYLLELLEVLKPGSRLTSAYPFWAIPLDTIRGLQREGWLGSPRYRPSRYRRLRAYREELLPGEAGLVQELAERGAAEPKNREALLLDAAYELWRYRTEGKAGDPEVESRLLARRSKFPAAAPPEISEKPPEQGHPSTRVGLAIGASRENSFAELSYRAALHDLLAEPVGYEENSELAMGDLRLRVEDNAFFLERFDLLRLRSLAPRERWIPRGAWAFRAGVARAKEFPCESWNCLSGGIEGGWGAAARLGPLLGFALVQAGAEAGRPFDRGYRIGAGPAGGLFAPLWAGARILLEGDWRLHLLGSRLAKREARLGLSQSLGRAWEMRAQFEVERGYREGLWQLLVYF
jgi:hypothetical protein